MSIAIENFVKAIYKHKMHDALKAKPGNIAKKLNISSAAATDMAKKLAHKDLVDYKKYKELELTAKGEKMALQVLRKHRIWESFLFKFFDLSLHEIHREAELLEHQTSDFLAEKIHAYLGYPDFDPHGDPIPNTNGDITEVEGSVTLHKALENYAYHIVCLQSDDKEFFDFCTEHNMISGAKVFVKKQLNTTGMTQIAVLDTVLLLNKEFTKKIYVK